MPVASLDGKILLHATGWQIRKIPAFDISQYFPHIAPVANKIPTAASCPPNFLLLVQDILNVHKVHEWYTGLEMFSDLS